jgi:UDP-N-acetylmuramoyl-tripeptide--D-alanyl-D-alanine ligase
MKELGPESARFHRELGESLALLDLKAVYLAGPEMGSAASALRSAHPKFSVEHSADPKDFASFLKGKLSASDAVLFKASRAMKLEELAKAL